MKSLEDRYFEIKNDPVKLARFFKITWIVAYSMLILGFILIIWTLVDARFAYNPNNDGLLTVILIFLLFYKDQSKISFVTCPVPRWTMGMIPGLGLKLCIFWYSV